MRALTRSLASVFVVAGPPPWPSQRGHQPSPKLVPRHVGENEEVKAVTDRPRLSLTFVSLDVWRDPLRSRPQGAGPLRRPLHFSTDNDAPVRYHHTKRIRLRTPGSARPPRQL